MPRLPRRLRTAPVLAAAALTTALTVALTPVALAQHAGHTMSGPMSMPVPAPARAAASAPLPLVVSGARVVAVPPGIGETSFFAVLKNTSGQPVTLRGAQADFAGMAMLMRTVRSGALTGMQDAAALTVPARGTLTLSDTGDHIMLSGLKRALKVGERLTVTLIAADGRRLKVTATVLKPGQ